MLFETQLCIAKNILLCLPENLSQYWEYQYPMNSTSYNLRHKEMTTTRITYICILYISKSGVGLQKFFFGLKIRGARAPRAAPLDPQLIRSKANSDVADKETNRT